MTDDAGEKTVRILIVAVVCGFMWTITWSAMLADFQGKFPSIACQQFRSNLGFSMLISLLPPTWIIVPFMTGFYEYGFQFSRLPRCQR